VKITTWIEIAFFPEKLEVNHEKDFLLVEIIKVVKGGKELV
jgi:hypothetical protein